MKLGEGGGEFRGSPSFPAESRNWEKLSVIGLGDEEMERFSELIHSRLHEGDVESLVLSSQRDGVANLESWKMDASVKI